jgi:hypothetical protein
VQCNLKSLVATFPIAGSSVSEPMVHVALVVRGQLDGRSELGKII